VLVVESGAHRLTALAPGVVAVAGARHRTERPATVLAPGEVSLDVIFTPAPGQKLDERYDPSTQLVVSASPPELLVSGAGRDTPLERTLVLSDAVRSGILHVSVKAASCDEPPADADPEEFFPACHVHQQDWGIPIRLVPGATASLPLILRGTE